MNRFIGRPAIVTLISACVLSAAPARAQSISWGARAGYSATEAVQGSVERDETRRYLIGPTIEVGIPHSFGFEVSALYRRAGYSTVIQDIIGNTTLQRVRANSWEFPFTLIYYISDRPRMKPYVSGGYVLRHLSDTEEIVRQYGRDYITGQPFDRTFQSDTAFLLRSNPTHGLTFGGGVRLHAGLVAVSPEIRYTRWAGRAFEWDGSGGFHIGSTQNQIDLLVSLKF
jgi:hypothetical protein